MKDKISALMDDEIELDGYEYLLSAAKSEGELNECWSTYHLIGDVMRGSPVLSIELKAKLMARLDDEPTVLAPQLKKVFYKKPALMSVAASVAAVMFVGWMVLHQQVGAGVNQPSVEIAQNIPSEYLLAHQSAAPGNAAYFIQPASFTESEK